jgi:hypothetical protein
MTFTRRRQPYATNNNEQTIRPGHFLQRLRLLSDHTRRCYVRRSNPADSTLLGRPLTAGTIWLPVGDSIAEGQVNGNSQLQQLPTRVTSRDYKTIRSVNNRHACR